MRLYREEDEVRVSISISRLESEWGQEWPILFERGRQPSEVARDGLVVIKWSPGFPDERWLLVWPEHEEALARVKDEQHVRDVLRPDDRRRLRALKQEAREWWQNVDWVSLAEDEGGE